MKSVERWGIHVRLLVAAVVLISATTLTLGYMGVSIIHEFVQTRFEERIAFLARYLALNTELGILIDERAMLRRIAKNLLAEKDVARVTVLNKAGEELADVSMEIPGPFSVVELPVVIRTPGDENRPFQFEFQAGREETIGHVRITYSTGGIRELLITMKTRFLFLAIGLAGFCAIVFFFISRSMVAPVTRLAETARRVAAGNKGLRVETGNLPETRELAIAFNAMLDSLEESQGALEAAHQEMVRQQTLAELGKFSLMIAHEVKNPLGIIKSSVDMLKKEAGGETAAMMVAYIEDEVQRLNHLIEDFLLFARPAVPNFRETDVNRMLREKLERFRFQLDGAALSVETDIPTEAFCCQADPDLLGRAVENVLKNAAEANEYRGLIRAGAVIRGSRWILSVEDQGPGIPEENLRRVFDPFFTTRSKGTGLGLAFCAQVFSAHGGGIKVENRQAGGARFVMNIPQNPSQPSLETV
jgi:signal transduction histidine kinase